MESREEEEEEKKKERVWSNRPAYENFSDTEHPAPWFTIFHRNVTQGHSYPSGYCRALLVSQVRYFHLLISLPSSFIFLAYFFFFFASFSWLSRHTGGMCVYLGGFIFIWSGQWLWFGEFYWKIFYCWGIFERRDWWWFNKFHRRITFLLIFIWKWSCN